MLLDMHVRLRPAMQMIALGLIVVVFGSLAGYLAVQAVLWVIFTLA